MENSADLESWFKLWKPILLSSPDVWVACLSVFLHLCFFPSTFFKSSTNNSLTQENWVLVLQFQNSYDILVARWCHY